MAEIGWENMIQSHQSPVTSHQKKQVRFLTFWLLVTGFWLLSSGDLHACPMCTNLIERGKAAFQLFNFAKGIAWSILLMMSMPFLLIGGGVFAIYRAQKSKKTAGEVSHG